MSLESKLESGNQNQDNDNRLQVSSKGKRLFALLLDFIFALLFANTLVQVFREEHWDLVMQSRDLSGLVFFYGSIAFILLFKDIFGRSLGKLLLAMTIREIENLEQRPSRTVLVQRNILLLLFPVEGVLVLRDAYARRLADKWWKTVVLDDQKAMRGNFTYITWQHHFVWLFFDCNLIPAFRYRKNCCIPDCRTGDTFTSTTDFTIEAITKN